MLNVLKRIVTAKLKIFNKRYQGEKGLGCYAEENEVAIYVKRHPIGEIFPRKMVAMDVTFIPSLSVKRNAANIEKLRSVVKENIEAMKFLAKASASAQKGYEAMLKDLEGLDE
jgi:hypothetical protein